VSPHEPRLLQRRPRCRFCGERAVAVYDLRGPLIPVAPPPTVMQPYELAALCWDHHAAIAAATEWWTDPATGARWTIERQQRSFLPARHPTD
jgi:hypothetical protein